MATETEVLLDAIGDGLSLLTWEQDSFAYADSYDETSRRYRGLRHGQRVTLTDSSTGMLVKPEAASRQIAAEAAAQGTATTVGAAPTQAESGDGSSAGPASTGGLPFSQSAQPRRFHGSVPLEPTRVGRDAGRIADEVISHLAGLVGADVKVTLEISAEVQNGVSVFAPVHRHRGSLQRAGHGAFRKAPRRVEGRNRGQNSKGRKPPLSCTRWQHRLQTAKELLDHDDKLSLDDRTKLWDLLQYVMSDPKSDMAPAKKKIIEFDLKKAAAETRDIVTDLLAKYAAEMSKP